MAKIVAPAEVTPVEAPAVEETSSPVAPATSVFVLEDAALASIARKGGREAAPAKYVDEVKAAIGKDQAFGIPVEAGTKGTKITAELRKAAKQLGVHIKLWDRTEDAKRPAGVGPFVGFKVVDGPKEETPATATVPVVEAPPTA